MSDLSYCIDDFDELKELTNNNQDNDISINLDFTCFQCDCGKVNLFSEDKCCECGKLIEKDCKIDPKVSLRKEKFSNILDYIKASELRIKSMRKNINNGQIPKVYVEDFISFIQSILDRIIIITNKNIFQNTTFSSDVIETYETDKKIDEINWSLFEAYSIYEEILIIDVSSIWENSLRRLIRSIARFLDSTKLIILSIIADTAKEGIQSIHQAQLKLDEASEEITFFSNILKMKEIDMNFDLLSKGSINNTVLLTMIFCGSSYNDMNTSINEIEKGVYSYFKGFLKHPQEYYLCQNLNLLSLAQYKLMGLMSFSECKYFEKISVVVNLLEKSNKTDSDILKGFLGKYQKKFVYALTKIQELSQEFAFIFSYNPSKELIIKYALRWYKDLSEGVYRDITTILIASAYIIDKKSIDEEFLLKYMGFPDKLSYLENKTKLRLNVLTDGVEKILRHSEAHVDYDIISKEEKIIVRNLKYDKDNKVGNIAEISYSFDEFLKIENILAETIFSICAGLNIFIANNYNEYGEFTKSIEQEFEQPMDRRVIEYMLTFIGVVVNYMESTVEESCNVLQINCTSIERTDRELLEKVIPCISTIVLHEPEIELVRVEVFNTNEIFIGSIQIYTKYIKAFNKADKKYQKYEMVLLLKTALIKYEMEDNNTKLEDIFGVEFIFGMLSFSMPLLEHIRELEVLLLTDIKNYILDLRAIKEEFTYIYHTINEFSTNVSDIRLFNFISSVINSFICATDMLMKQYEINPIFVINEAYQEYKKGCLHIANVLNTEGSVQMIEELLKNNKSPKELLIASTKTGRNDKCTCGSGKKYKKCCG